MIYGKHIAALCIPKIHDDTNHKLIESLGRSLYRHGIKLLVYATPSELFWHTVDESGEKAVFDLINYDITDAVIIHTQGIKDKETVDSIIGKAQAHSVPVITIGEQRPGCFGVSFNYKTGFEKIVRHVLQDHKISNFHFIAGQKGNHFSNERQEIVQKVAQELDIPFGDEDVSYGEFWSRPTEEAVERLFTVRRRFPRAIICANDSMAIATVNVLKKHGKRIPEDVIVTGFDGISEIKYSIPSITTCFCSSDHLAESITDIVMETISGNTKPEYRLVEPELWRAESCGCPGRSYISPSEELAYVNNSFYRFQAEEEHMFRMISRILECHSFSQISELLDDHVFYDMMIAINKECTDRTINPMERCTDRAYGENVRVIFNTTRPDSGWVDDFDPSGLRPDLEDMVNEHENPLIFFSLNYVGIPMGYVCFNYFNYDIQNYYKASQIVNMLNCGFGAFRAAQYQHYLSEKIEEMYRCDGLTHLLNRTALKNSYQFLHQKCGNTMTVVLADLDGLKHINDTYGHDDGDFAICTVAQALRMSCPEDSLCVRWGGDEMVAVIPGTVSADSIRDEIDRYLENANRTSGKPYRISASVGVKSFDAAGSSELENMVRTTDQLMYSEKKRKKQQNGSSAATEV